MCPVPYGLALPLCAPPTPSEHAKYSQLDFMGCSSIPTYVDAFTEDTDFLEGENKGHIRGGVGKEHWPGTQPFLRVCGAEGAPSGCS